MSAAGVAAASLLTSAMLVVPRVQGVRLPLHVPGAVGETDELEAVALVEPARADVLLEHPELEAVRPQTLGVLEQRGADAAVLCRRRGVEVRELVPAETGEAEDPGVVLGDRELAPPSPRTESSARSRNRPPSRGRTSSGIGGR